MYWDLKRICNFLNLMYGLRVYYIGWFIIIGDLKDFLYLWFYSLFLKEFNLLDEFLIRVESFWFRVFIVG